MSKFLQILQLFCLTLIGCSSNPQDIDRLADANPSSQKITDADQLLIVDCLLPGEIRQLGLELTYVTQRRPVKTTAFDCAVRGGEYVRYDRANLATALKVWSEKAEAGDAEAQVYTGEIYARGLGTTPDYQTAAAWYRKAAAQNNKRAQMNLGYLYEKGLGVEKNLPEAMSWYQKASGLDQLGIPYAATVKTSSNNEHDEQINLLKSDLNDTQIETKALKKRLEESQAHLRDSLERKETLSAELTKVKAQLSDGKKDDDDHLTQLLANKDKELAQLQLELANQETNYRQEVEQLKQKLDEASNRAQQITEQLKTKQVTDDNLQLTLVNTERRLAETEKKLLDAHNQLMTAQTSLQNKERVDTAKSSLLENEKKQFESRINELEQEKNKYIAEIQSLKKSDAKNISASKPVIEIIEPPFVLLRGMPTVTLRSPVKEREIVGKVSTNVGIMSLFVNDKKNSVNEQGIFNASVNINAEQTPVQVVAIDKNGARESLNFLFLQEATNMDARHGDKGEFAKTNTVTNPFKDINFGEYHALIIGNNRYKKIPALETPVNDAKAVEELLRTKYGFKTTMLLDGDRYQILSAMNELRSKLTEKDNLLIYYGGHGELDRVNMRGHWLPIDADADNDANWISTVSITDILNSMSAKHIMVVADTCYSGAMTRSGVGRIEAGMDAEKKSEWLKAMLKAKSRTVLTSGGLKPVMDGGAGDHSVFANAFIKALENNAELMEGQDLYRKVSTNVVAIASNYEIEQVPQYSPISHAGHEAGEFFFVPK